MKRIISKYSPIALLIVLGVPAGSMALIGIGPEYFGVGAIIGYTSIIVAMATVYFAMREFRDKRNDGILSFQDGMKIGLTISAIGGLAWGIYNAIFVTYVMPDFNEQYFAYTMDLEIGTPKFEAEFAANMQSNEFMMSTFGQSIVMFMTVFLIGLVLSVISSLVLKTKQVQPA